MSAEERIVREELLAIEEALRNSSALGVISPWLAAQEVRTMFKAGKADKNIANLLFKCRFGPSLSECLDLAEKCRESYNRVQRPPLLAAMNSDPKLPL